jgi:RNA polymerase sigma-70 factor (ECF subfamily)
MRARVRSSQTDRSAPTADELNVLHRYIEYHEQQDIESLAALLREDVRLNMPPIANWYEGRDLIKSLQAPAFEVETFGQLRGVSTRSNLQPAVAWYLKRPGETSYQALAIDVLEIDGGEIVEITTFADPAIFSVFGLAPTA